MHFFVLNTEHGYIAKIVGQPDLQQIYKIIGCQLIDAAHLHGTSDVLLVDDEGLFHSTTYLDVKQEGLLHIEGIAPRILAGNAIYIGTSPEGESIEPEHTFQYAGYDENGDSATLTADESKKAIARITPQILLYDNRRPTNFITLYEYESTTITEYTIPEYLAFMEKTHGLFPENAHSI